MYPYNCKSNLLLEGSRCSRCSQFANPEFTGVNEEFANKANVADTALSQQL
jgi:hypothetical protein